MINEYSRTELLLGKESVERLKAASVMVFGVGGVGSHCIEALARSGVGRLTLVDNDTVPILTGSPLPITVLSEYMRQKS